MTTWLSYLWYCVTVWVLDREPCNEYTEIRYTLFQLELFQIIQVEDWRTHKWTLHSNIPKETSFRDLWQRVKRLRTTQMTLGLKPQDFLYWMKRNHLAGLQAGYGITLKTSKRRDSSYREAASKQGGNMLNCLSSTVSFAKWFMDWVVESYQPLSTCESESFRATMQSINKNWR